MGAELLWVVRSRTPRKNQAESNTHTTETHTCTASARSRLDSESAARVASYASAPDAFTTPARGNCPGRAPPRPPPTTAKCHHHARPWSRWPASTTCCPSFHSHHSSVALVAGIWSHWRFHTWFQSNSSRESSGKVLQYRQYMKKVYRTFRPVPTNVQVNFSRNLGVANRIKLWRIDIRYLQWPGQKTGRRTVQCPMQYPRS